MDWLLFLVLFCFISMTPTQVNMYIGNYNKILRNPKKRLKNSRKSQKIRENSGKQYNTKSNIIDLKISKFALPKIAESLPKSAEKMPKSAENLQQKLNEEFFGKNLTKKFENYCSLGLQGEENSEKGELTSVLLIHRNLTNIILNIYLNN